MGSSLREVNNLPLETEASRMEVGCFLNAHEGRGHTFKGDCQQKLLFCRGCILLQIFSCSLH